MTSEHSYTALIDSVAKDISSYLKLNWRFLHSLNQQITDDSTASIQHDHSTTLSYLKNFSKSLGNLSKVKPKGRILLILSYNEPMILGIIPVINALAAGNEVTIKPSKRSREVFQEIWIRSGIRDKYSLPLEILDAKEYNIVSTIKHHQAVYFFGGLKAAQQIYKLCAKYFIDFFPEIETADFKVFSKKSPAKLALKKDAEITLTNAFFHAGQSCQRLQGIFVPERYFEQYCDELQSALPKFVHIGKTHSGKYNPASIKKLKDDILIARPISITSSATKPPLIIFKPRRNSRLVKEAYFLPTLWVLPFNSPEDLLAMLARRYYRMGLNIITDDKYFRDLLVKKTNFSRYTLHDNHVIVLPDEGWGGMWPSGFTGNRHWVEQFSNDFEIINLPK